MTDCDVVIVGGGPAGSSCAWKLRRAGLNVVVWDRRRFPRDKICAGWITPQILAELQLDPEAYTAGGLTFQPFTGFAISRLGDSESRIRYGRPVSYGIRRCEFDHYLLQRSGAELCVGQPVRTLQRRNGAWVLNDTVRAKLLVGAGGHFCPVAQLLGAKLGIAEPIVAAQEAEFELSPTQQLTCKVESDVPEIFFTRDLKGYGWVVRKGAYINIGLGRQDSHRLGEHVARFVAFLEQRGKIPEHLPAKFLGHPYLLYGAGQRPLLGDAALVIGDAAGLAYSQSGEGIRPAIESGLLAADTILEAAGTYSREGLAGYEQRVVTRFGPRRTGPGLTEVLPQWVAGPIAGSLFASAWFARHVVVDRWFLHRQQPPLAEDPSPTVAARSGQEQRPRAQCDSNPSPAMPSETVPPIAPPM